jgi:hypothetical protein
MVNRTHLTIAAAVLLIFAVQTGKTIFRRWLNYHNLNEWHPGKKIKIVNHPITISGFAIKCWECRSDSDPKCADPFDNSTLSITDCRHEQPKEHLPGVKATMCRKIRQKVNGKWRYFRSCAWMGEPGIEGDERFCIMRTGSYNIFMEYCTCELHWFVKWMKELIVLFPRQLQRRMQSCGNNQSQSYYRGLNDSDLTNSSKILLNESTLSLDIRTNSRH